MTARPVAPTGMSRDRVGVRMCVLLYWWRWACLMKRGELCRWTCLISGVSAQLRQARKLAQPIRDIVVVLGSTPGTQVNAGQARQARDGTGSNIGIYSHRFENRGAGWAGTPSAGSVVHQVLSRSPRTLLIPWPYARPLPCNISPLSCLPHQSSPSNGDPEHQKQKVLCAPSPAATPAESAARSPLAPPPPLPCSPCHTEMRRADEHRGQLLHLRSSPPPVPRLRCQTSRVAAGNLPPPSSPRTPSHIPQENRNVLDLREKIKTFLASQGMIKGHSGSAPRDAEQDPQVLTLSAEYGSPSDSPQTPTLSIPSTNDERPSSYPLRTDRYPDNDRKTPVSPPLPSCLSSPQVYPSCTS